MIAKGQSPEAQAARLAMGCCPIHGTSVVGQIAGWYSSVTRDADQPDDYTLGGCPRGDCDVVAKITKAEFEKSLQDQDEGPAVTVVTAADVHPEMWAQVEEWFTYKHHGRGAK